MKGRGEYYEGGDSARCGARHRNGASRMAERAARRAVKMPRKRVEG